MTMLLSATCPFITIKSGNGNIAIGYKSGGGNKGCGPPSHMCAPYSYEKYANRSGNYNIWIGNESGPKTLEQLKNSIAIGYKAHNTKSNQTVIGNKNISETILYGDVAAGKSIQSNIIQVRETEAKPHPVNGVAQIYYDKKEDALKIMLSNGKIVRVNTGLNP